MTKVPARTMLGPDPKLSPQLTTHGLKQTLRARYLAQRAGRRTVMLHHSIVPALAPVRRVPKIMASAEPGPMPKKLHSLFAEASSMLNVGCQFEAQRLGNYAGRIIEDVVATSDQDLELFAADGVATAAFERVLLNMASVEIGPMAPSPALVKAALSVPKGVDASLVVSPLVSKLWPQGFTALNRLIGTSRRK